MTNKTPQSPAGQAATVRAVNLFSFLIMGVAVLAVVAIAGGILVTLGGLFYRYVFVPLIMAPAC